MNTIYYVFAALANLGYISDIIIFFCPLVLYYLLLLIRF